MEMSSGFGGQAYKATSYATQAGLALGGVVIFGWIVKSIYENMMTKTRSVGFWSAQQLSAFVTVLHRSLATLWIDSRLTQRFLAGTIAMRVEVKGSRLRSNSGCL